MHCTHPYTNCTSSICNFVSFLLCRILTKKRVGKARYHHRDALRGFWKESRRNCIKAYHSGVWTLGSSPDVHPLSNLSKNPYICWVYYDDLFFNFLQNLHDVYEKTLSAGPGFGLTFLGNRNKMGHSELKKKMPDWILGASRFLQ